MKKPMILVGLIGILFSCDMSRDAGQGLNSLGPLTVSAEISPYDRAILANFPILYLTMGNAASGQNQEPDLSGRGHHAVYYKGDNWLYSVFMPNGDLAARFNGLDQYLEIPDSDDFSISTTGSLTIEAWIRPTELEFITQEGTGYVHWLGKGVPGQHEYALRMYSKTTSDDPPRPNRISGYAFNLNGNLGSGSYFQDEIIRRQWIHLTLVFTTDPLCSHYPTGYVKIYRDGILRGASPLAQYNVIPENGTAPLRVGTRQLTSFFLGAVGKLAFYNYELPRSQILKHYHTMMGME